MLNQKRYLVFLDIYDESLLSLISEIQLGGGSFVLAVDDVLDKKQLFDSIVATNCGMENSEDNFTDSEVQRITNEITHANINFDELSAVGYTKIMAPQDALVMIVDRERTLNAAVLADIIKTEGELIGYPERTIVFDFNIDGVRVADIPFADYKNLLEGNDWSSCTEQQAQAIIDKYKVDTTK